jgi:hypothetical protein
VIMKPVRKTKGFKFYSLNYFFIRRTIIWIRKVLGFSKIFPTKDKD